MKKLLVLIAALFLATGFVMAQDTGLSLGVEFGVANVTKVDDGDMLPYLYPHLKFDRPFANGLVDFFTEAGVVLGFYDVPDKDNNNVKPIGLYFDLALTCNLFLGYSSKLSFTLENEIDLFAIKPRFENSGYGMDSWFKPGLKFTQGIAAGDFYLKAVAPIQYLTAWEEGFDLYSLNIEGTVGFDSSSGFGISVKEVFALKPESGHEKVELLVSYENDLLYAGVEVVLPNEFGDIGLTITPEISVNLTRTFSTYVS